MSEPVQAFPLQWPPGRRRLMGREHAPFKVAMGRSLKDIGNEVGMLGGTHMVISTNMPVRRDGLPYSDRRVILDPGAAVYFSYKGRQVAFACDRWDTLEANLRAISKTINALRGIDRWGTGDMVAAAFTGFTALPAPEQPWQVLGLTTSSPTREQIDQAYRLLAKEHHPDNGGTQAQMARINVARDELYERFAP